MSGNGNTHSLLVWVKSGVSFFGRRNVTAASKIENIHTLWCPGHSTSTWLPKINVHTRVSLRRNTQVRLMQQFVRAKKNAKTLNTYQKRRKSLKYIKCILIYNLKIYMDVCTEWLEQFKWSKSKWYIWKTILCVKKVSPQYIVYGAIYTNLGKNSYNFILSLLKIF